jgi:hypothetical protein
MQWQSASVTKFWVSSNNTRMGHQTHMDVLQKIRDMQFVDKSGAEALLLSFFRDELGLSAVATQLTPKPTSLNSFNGFVTLQNGERKFFKTHTENDTVITEYYNSGMLAQAGYPIIQPTFQSTATGKQILLYDIIESPSVFEVAWAIENGDSAQLTALTQAQQQADRDLYDIYTQTLTSQSSDDNAKTPIHQLFYHRLVAGRLKQFYSGEIALPDARVTMREVEQWRWQINGQVYNETLERIIQRAIILLNPQQASIGVIGHGDAHNGNVFLRDTTPASLLYFDPAFAGKHHPLLDLVKPLFHNVFAMWMYYPNEKHEKTPISWSKTGNFVTVNYDYPLHPVRQLFWQSKIQHTLIPILQLLHTRAQLRSDWREWFKLALFCCPFLTMNLTDLTKFSPKISLLGLAMSIEMGAESHNTKSLLDQTLDEIEILLI